MSDNKSGGLLGGMIIGAALGAIAGILATPRTGKETRHILKKSADALPELAEDLATSIQFHADRLSDTSLANWDQTLGRLREAIVAGRSASRQEWVRQSSVDYEETLVSQDIPRDTLKDVYKEPDIPPINESPINEPQINE